MPDKLQNTLAAVMFTLCLLLHCTQVLAQSSERFSISAKSTPIGDVMAMFSQKGRVNIMLAKEVSGDVSFNLYDVTLDEAIRAIAEIGGYAAEKRGSSYFIIDRKDVGGHSTRGLTSVRTFEVQYADPATVESVLKNHLSKFGKITVAQDRKLLVVEDMPDFLRRIAGLVKTLDRAPRQILIEAKILEVTLNDSLSYGIDWTKLFSVDPGEIKEFGTQNLALPGSPGLFVNVVNENIDLLLTALKTDGRLRTISTPKLLALENEEASVVVGDRIGYKVTTTINQVTTESVEFLESGVILRVTPSVDDENRILLDIYPQISTATVTEGIPSKTTTEVTTRFIADNRQTIFIGGLLKNSLSEFEGGVPVLKSIPLLGRLFSSLQTVSLKTETIVLITPYIVSDIAELNGRNPLALERQERDVQQHINQTVYGAKNQRVEASVSGDQAHIESSENREVELPQRRGPRR